MNTKVFTPPEMSELQVKLTEEMRNHKDPIMQACASLLDTRVEWHCLQAYKAALADGFVDPDVMAAFIRMMGGQIFAFLQMQKDPLAQQILLVITIIELQNITEKLVKMAGPKG